MEERRQLKHSRDEWENHPERSGHYQERSAKRTRRQSDSRDRAEEDQRERRNSKDVDRIEQDRSNDNDNENADTRRSNEKTEAPRVGSAIGAVVNVNHHNQQNYRRETNNHDSTSSSYNHFHHQRSTNESSPPPLPPLPSPRESAETKKALIEDTYKKPEILGRNKRMFGSLMGHLGLAKVRIEKDIQKINKQQQFLEDVKKKQMEEGQRLEIQKLKEKKKLVYDEHVLTIQSLANKHRGYLESLQYFLFTQTEPKLAWLPVNHNKFSKELLAKRQEQIIRELAEREITDNKKLHELSARYEADLLHIEESVASRSRHNQQQKERFEGKRESKDEYESSPQHQEEDDDDNHNQDTPADETIINEESKQEGISDVEDVVPEDD